eukprot:scaffold7803_cov228-Ochromonas_danica.AAC.1
MPPIKENFRTFDVGVKVIADDLVKSMDGIQNVITKFGGDGVMLEKLQLEIGKYIGKCQQISDIVSKTAVVDGNFQNARQNWGNAYDGMCYLLYKLHADQENAGLLPSLKFNLFSNGEVSNRAKSCEKF